MNYSWRKDLFLWIFFGLLSVILCVLFFCSAQNLSDKLTELSIFESQTLKTEERIRKVLSVLHTHNVISDASHDEIFVSMSFSKDPVEIAGDNHRAILSLTLELMKQKYISREEGMKVFASLIAIEDVALMDDGKLSAFSSSTIIALDDLTKILAKKPIGEFI